MICEKSYALSDCCREKASSLRCCLMPVPEKKVGMQESRSAKKRACVCARLSANPSQLALVSILLSNDCPLENKIDYIKHQT